jgi:hypothetical protein
MARKNQNFFSTKFTHCLYFNQKNKKQKNKKSSPSPSMAVAKYVNIYNHTASSHSLSLVNWSRGLTPASITRITPSPVFKTSQVRRSVCESGGQSVDDFGDRDRGLVHGTYSQRIHPRAFNGRALVGRGHFD